MDKFDILLNELINLSLTQENRDWMEDIPEDLYEEYFEDIEEIENNLNIDTHRWYELSTTVFEIDGRYLGVRSITNMFSEMSEPSDIGFTIEFFEMKPVRTITYRKIL